MNVVVVELSLLKGVAVQESCVDLMRDDASLRLVGLTLSLAAVIIGQFTAMNPVIDRTANPQKTTAQI